MKELKYARSLASFYNLILLNFFVDLAMEIQINRLNAAMHFRASNAAGKTIDIDGAGGEGMQPMQILLAAVGTCAGFDVVAILKKQRQLLKDIQILVTGERHKDAVPKPFTTINIHFNLYGNIRQDKAARAVELAVHKYCSVGATVEKQATISSSFEIIAD